VAFGGALYLAHHGRELPDHRAFRGEPAELRSPTGILAEARELRGRALIEIGLLALIATPVARVVFSLAAFARERDRVFVAITLLVLVVLLYSLLCGGARSALACALEADPTASLSARTSRTAHPCISRRAAGAPAAPRRPTRRRVR
jgi:hypothetical protein